VIGGSKRAPRKNIRPFRGKTLWVWSLDATEESKYLDRVVLSTDDDEIAHMGAQECVDVIDRPAELATDDASNEDVLRHAMSLYPHDWVVLLQPTSPLRTAEDIDACLERAQMGDGCITYSDGTWQKNGAVYVAKREWIERHDFHHQGLLKLYMPAERSLDIDYPEDFDK
jgi:CMP-N-acetylneuraminic acid synthetase